MQTQKGGRRSSPAPSVCRRSTLLARRGVLRQRPHDLVGDLVVRAPRGVLGAPRRLGRGRARALGLLGAERARAVARLAAGWRGKGGVVLRESGEEGVGFRAALENDDQKKGEGSESEQTPVPRSLSPPPSPSTSLSLTSRRRCRRPRAPPSWRRARSPRPRRCSRASSRPRRRRRAAAPRAAAGPWRA